MIIGCSWKGREICESYLSKSENSVVPIETFVYQARFPDSDAKVVAIESNGKSDELQNDNSNTFHLTIDECKRIYDYFPFVVVNSMFKIL